MPPTKALNEAVALIRASQRIAIAAHVSPDVDAIGSTLGLGLALQSLGKQVLLLSEDGVPENLRFLPGAGLLRDALPPDFVPDLFIGLDSSDPDRLGDIVRPLLDGRIPVLNVDHHITNLNFGAINVVMPECAATAEVIVVLLDALGVPLGEDVAGCLMAGLVGDTRGFSVASVTPATFEVAARLLAAGADLAAISEAVLNRRSVGILRFWGVALSNLHLEDGLLWATVSLEERRRLDLMEIQKPELTNVLISAEEAEVAVLFTEKPDGLVDVSFRAKPGHDVAGVALALGGGGHPLAAGCEIEGPLDSAVRRVIGLLRERIALPAGGDGER
ncbi:MAG TPA: bifunctional oligoribonuclease/PAP phosphatase NrnA [Chloroflexi bacterium]|nr:bifunctional oligoribonuclease/PAP phosphatase NrnA [Chloroflexota bacterium]